MRKVIKAVLLTVLSFLIQTCVMQHLKVGGVTANFLAINIAILTVSLGKKYAFGASCMTGILLEATTYSVGALYAVIYPVIGMGFAYIFADMSDEKREKRFLRQMDEKKGMRGDMNPHLRIPLNAMCIAAAVEVILLVYATLSGTELTVAFISRALLAVVYTGLLATVVMFPARLVLRMYGRRVRRAMIEDDRV